MQNVPDLPNRPAILECLLNIRLQRDERR
jgi:hypothetical protein